MYWAREQFMSMHRTECSPCRRTYDHRIRPPPWNGGCYVVPALDTYAEVSPQYVGVDHACRWHAGVVDVGGMFDFFKSVFLTQSVNGA